MHFVYFLCFLSLFFGVSEQDVLVKTFFKQGSFNITMNTKNTNILSIYSIDTQINVTVPVGFYANVNQVNIYYPPNSQNNVIKLSSNSNNLVTVWFKFLNITNFIPGACSPNVSRSVTPNVIRNQWLLQLEYFPGKMISDRTSPCSQIILSNFSYYLIYYPISPRRNLENMDNAAIRSLDVKLYLNHFLKDPTTLEVTPVLLNPLYEGYGSMDLLRYQVFHRRDYTGLYVLKAFSVRHKVEFFYPPYIIFAPNDVGQQNLQNPVVISMFYVSLVVACLVFCVLTKEIVQFFFHTWIIIVFISAMIRCPDLFREDTAILMRNMDALMFVVTVLGLGPVGSLILTAVAQKLSSTGSRVRMFPTALVIAYTLGCIAWFGSLYIKQAQYVNCSFFGVTTGLSLLILLYCNIFTMTFGALFVYSLVAGLSISVLFLKSSIIPVVFVDVYVFFQQPSSLVWNRINYFTMPDLTLTLCCFLLTLVVGGLAYCRFEKKSSTVSTKSTSPDTANNMGFYGSTGAEGGTIPLGHNTIDNQPQQSMPTFMPCDPPPSYSEISHFASPLNMPTAPRFSNIS